MQRYPSKIGVGFLVFILIIVLGSSMVLINNREWIGLGINILILSFVAYTLMNIYYVIDLKVLKIRCGFFFKKTIAIDTIYKISESRNPTSAPAASLDRLELFYSQNKSVLVSSREKQNFVDHLIRLNVQIEFEKS